MIDRKVHSGFVRPPAEPNADDIKASVNEFLETNPVTPGASAEEAAQIKLNAENIEKLQTLSEGLDTVVISDSAPNTDNKCLWIQSGQYESFDIPQINDETVSEEDTWSSKKISDELNAQVSQLSEEIDTKTSALKSDLAEKINKPTSDDNNKFPRAKDGNVEWVEQGLPTDEQTANAVQNWLNEHPEATTTVQDGVITETKIHSDFLPYIKKDYVTPEMFGAKADGEKSVALNKSWKYCDNMDLLKDELSNGTIHDDTNAINSALRSGKKVVFDKKTYIITDTLLINSNVFVDFNYARIVMVSNKNIIEVVGSNSTIDNAFLYVADYSTFSKSGVYFGNSEAENIVFNNLKIYNYKSVTSGSVVNNIKTSQDVHTENIGGVGIYAEKLKSNTVSGSYSMCNCHFNDFYIYGFATGIKMYVEDRSTNFPWISTNFFKGSVWFSRHCLDIGRESKNSFNQLNYFDLMYQFTNYFPSEVLNVVDQDRGNFKIFMWDVQSAIKFCYNYGISNIFRFNTVHKKIIDFSDNRNMFVEMFSADDVSHNQKYIMNLDKYGGIVENGEFVLVNRVSSASKTTLNYAFGLDKFKLRNFKITYDIFIEGEDGVKAAPAVILNFVDGVKKLYGYLTDNNKYTINEFDDETNSFVVNDVTGLSVNNIIRPTIYSSEGVVYTAPDIAPNLSPAIKISNIDVDSKRIYYKSNILQQYLDIFKDCKAFVKDFSNKGNYNPVYNCLASEKDGVAYIPCNAWYSTNNTIMCSGYFTNYEDFTISLSFMSVNTKELKSCKIKNLCIDYL